MKILMMNRPRESWVGGDMVQMDATMKALEQLGHQVRYDDGQDLEAVRWAEICHLWNFSMNWTWGQYATCDAIGKPVVCSTIYHDTDVSLPFRIQQKLANKVDALIFLCDGEVRRMANRLYVDPKKIHIIPNGIEEEFFKSVPQAEDYALTVGRLEEFKGQRHVAKVCRELGIRYVCIGDGFDKMVLHELGAEIIPSMPREQLVEYYAKCKFFILASKNEIFPMSVLEAAAQNKRIILTEDSCWQPEGAITCKYGDLDSIREAIAWTASKGTINVTGMRWSAIARQLEEVYRCVLSQQ